MKKSTIYTLYFFCLITCTLPTASQAGRNSNFDTTTRLLYWVGGTGDWTDPLHWSLSSGGTGGELPPTLEDDVFFDQNSGLAGGGTITIDVTATCKNMDFTGTTGNPLLHFNNSILVYGSLTLVADMQLAFPNWVFSSSLPGCTITSGGHNLGSVQFLGIGGIWTFQDPFAADYVNHGYGTIITNNHPVTTGNWQRYDPEAFNPYTELFLGSSTLTITSPGTQVVLFYAIGKCHSENADLVFEHGGTLVAEDGIIFQNISFLDAAQTGYLNEGNVSGKLLFEGYGVIHYFGPHIIHEAEFQKGAAFYGSSTFDILTLTPGQEYLFFGGSTQTITPGGTINGLVGVDCTDRMYLHSMVNGQPAYLYKDGADLTFNWLDVRDISVSGSAQFIANNSAVYGSSTGWTSNYQPRNLYWVNGSGNWSDISHWEDEFGVGYQCPPTALDNVFFDQNSGLSGGGTITVDIAATCKNMDFTGTTGNPLLLFNNSISVYGSLTLVPDMQLAMPNWVFGSTEPGRTITSGGHNLGSVQFLGIGGVWTFQDPFVADYVNHGYGTIFTNNHPVTTGNWQRYDPEAFNPYAELFLGSSTLTITGPGTQVVLFYAIGKCHSENADLIFEHGGTLVAEDGVTFHNISFLDPAQSGYLNEGNVTGKLLFEGYGAIYYFGPHIIHEAQFQQDGAFYGASTFDILRLTPGKNYIFNSYTTQTITYCGLLDAVGTNSDPIQMSSTNPGEAAIIEKNGIRLCVDWVNMSDIHKSGTAPFFAGANSTDGGNNTGWNFSACPAFGVPMPELCDGIDNDCDGDVDEGLSVALSLDYDYDCLSPGENIEIIWSGGCPNWTVDLTLYRISPNVPEVIIAQNIPNTGSVTWTIPGGVSLTDYHIYIKKSTAPVVDDYGDSFTINNVASFYADADGDGYGAPNNTVVACAAPTGYVADNTDCDDGNDQVYPGSGQPTPVCISNRIVSIGADGTYQLTPEQLLAAGELPCGATASLDVTDFDCADVTTIPSPRQNYSLAFDGVNEYVSLASPFSGTGNYTVEAWFKSENTGNCSGVNTYKRLLGWGTAQLEFADCGGILLFRASGLWQSTTVNVRDNIWHHIAAVRQGNRHIVYVDGVKKLDFSQTPANVSGSFYIGRGSSGSALWKGRIDECRVWNIARSQADILGWKNKPLPGAQAGLVGYWNFDGGPGSSNLVSNIGGPSGTMVNMEPSLDWVSGAPLQYLAPIPVVATINDGGSITNCASLITVVDAQAPVLQCKSTYTVSSGTAINVLDLLDNPTTDNCGILFQGADRGSFTCAETGVQNVTVTAVDINSNQATCFVPVTVQDGFQYSCQDAVKELSAVGLALLNPNDIVTLTPSACGVYGISLSQTLFDCTDVGINSVTATISNGAGSTFSCVVNVTISDVTPPVVTCQPFTLPLNAAGNATLTPQQVLSSATDACGIAGYSLDINQFDCSDVGQQAVILTATDNNGLSASCTATVTVSDNQGPVLNCQNVELDLNANGEALLTAAMVSPTITDNCGLAGTSLSQSALDCSNITPEPSNYALNFTGTNNYYVAFSSALTGTSNFTFEAWFIDNNTGSVPKYLVGWQSAFFELFDVNGLLYARFGGSVVNTNVNIRDGVWHHVAVTRSGSTVTIFLDGNIIWTGTRNFNLGLSFQLGRKWSASPSTQGPWIGKIDEVRLWNVVLTQTQIQAGMSKLLQGAEPGLIGYWPMNEGPGNASAQDTSPNNNPGVLSGVMSPATAWVGGAPVQSPGAVVPVTLTATDVNGLTSTCTVSVTVDDDLHPCCPAPVALCKNTTVSLGSGGTYTLLPSQIDDGSNAACGIQSMSAVPNALTCANAGVQSVSLTVTDNSGATATCSSLVTVLGKPDISTIDAPIICFGDEFDLAGLNLSEATGMAYSLSYHHTSPATAGNELPSPVVAPLVTATYYVQAISAATNCKDELPVVVTVIPEPELEIYLYQSPQICQGEIYYLNGVGIEVGSNSSLLDYSWHYALPPTPDNEIMNGDVSPSINTTYYIAMLDGSGCTVIRNLPVVVNPGPDISVPAPAATCPGETVDLAALAVTDANNTGASLTYHSATPAGPGNELPSPLVSPAATTTYYILATAPNGCKDEAPVTIMTGGTVQAECRDITVYLDSNGEYLLAANQIDDGSTSSCGSVTLSASPSLFSCNDLGDNVVTLTVTGAGGATATCAAVVTVEALGDRLIGTALEPGNGAVFSLKPDGSDFNSLHLFEVPPENPYAPLLEGPDGFLYGTTLNGGNSGSGTIYRIRLDGTGREVLYSFDEIHGSYSGLTLDVDGFLYGTTFYGGSSGVGTVYRIQTDGSNFEILYNFDYTNGGYPFSSLSFGSDGLLYGTTYGGGSYYRGTVYRLQTDGTGYEVIHSFNNDLGSYPYAGLMHHMDGFLYGTTYYGGNFGLGTVYRLRLDGTDFEIIHSFNEEDGTSPYAGLIASTGDFLYGTTSRGGDSGGGVVYRLKPDGTMFEVLHYFNYGDGNNIRAGLIEGGEGFLYGTAAFGGEMGRGVVYRLMTDGTAYSVLHSFNAIDGAYPYTKLLVASDGLLYGTTYYSGYTEKGGIFRLQKDGLGFETFFFENNNGAYPLNKLTLHPNGYLFGVTKNGGFEEWGLIFRIRPDGTGFTVVHFFDRDNGWSPSSGLTLHTDGYFYGTTAYGGNSQQGTVYRMNADGTGFQILHNFDEGEYVYPNSSLVIGPDEFLYGTTLEGGDMGTVYRLRTDGTDYEVIFSFSTNDGVYPSGSLVLASDNYVYGVNYHGGSFGAGTLFRMQTNGADFEVLHTFDFEENNGARPNGIVLGSDGLLYGVTSTGGEFNNGILYSFDPNGGGFQLLHAFNESDGIFPLEELTLGSDGRIYGATYRGGSYNWGTIYRINPDGANFTVLRHLNGADAGNPRGALLYLPGYDCGGGLAIHESGQPVPPPVQQEASLAGLVLYPNPTTGEINLVFSSVPQQSLPARVYNAQGAVVWQGEISQSATRIDLSAQPDGVYTVQWQWPGQAAEARRVVLAR